MGVFLYARARGAAPAAPAATDTSAPTQIGGGALTADQSGLEAGVNDLAAYLAANGLVPPPTTGTGNPGSGGVVLPRDVLPPPQPPSSLPPPIGHVPGGSIIGGGIGPVAV